MFGQRNPRRPLRSVSGCNIGNAARNMLASDCTEKCIDLGQLWLGPVDSLSRGIFLPNAAPARCILNFGAVAPPVRAAGGALFEYETPATLEGESDRGQTTDRIPEIAVKLPAVLTLPPGRRFRRLPRAALTQAHGHLQQSMNCFSGASPN